MKIQVQGHTVEVGDQFANLSDAEKQATIDEIASHIQASTQQAQQPKPPEAEESTGKQILNGAVGAGTMLGGSALAKGGLKFLAERNLAGKVGEAIRGAIKPTAEASTKVAEMASSNAVRDIALQGLQRGVQGVTAAAGAIAPYVRGLSGAALALHSEGLNNGEDQLVQQMHQQQDQGVANGQLAPPPGPAQPPQAPYQGAVAPQGQ